MGTRRKARELALQLLFFMEFNQKSRDSWNTFWQLHPASEPARKFASRLVNGVIENQEAFDALIKKHLLNWSLDRMTIIDRSVLRLAVSELTVMKDIPFRVTIDEAIEIARRYGNEHSASFVNGVLDHIVKDQEMIAVGKEGS